MCEVFVKVLIYFCVMRFAILVVFVVQGVSNQDCHCHKHVCGYAGKKILYLIQLKRLVISDMLKVNSFFSTRSIHVNMCTSYEPELHMSDCIKTGSMITS